MVGSASGTVAGVRQAPSGDLATDSSPMQRGKIEVAPRAIATIAGRAVAECYGVVGIAARRTRLGAVEMLAPEHYNRGVEVRFANDHITIEVYVVLEHGLRISEIAHNIMEGVKFAVEKALGMRVVQVNVNVQALRVNPEPER
ncbi:MAG TPA: Asp23/Gls24 family envelope stress response protein [Ktedonobacterales bacterium]|nr:Asp23/Gls24 family envelope stress response protein [Ktedonobacterales bacterium]